MSRRLKYETKTSHTTHAVLETEVMQLWRKIEDNQASLISPFTTTFSVVLWPFLQNVFLRSHFFSLLREYLGNPHREEFFSMMNQAFPRQHIAVGQARRTIAEFEEILPKMAQHLHELEQDNMVTLLKGFGYPHATPENYLSILLNEMPFRLKDLSRMQQDGIEYLNHQHLMYFMAGIIDNIYKGLKNPGVHNRFNDVLLAIIYYMPRPLSLAEMSSVPEYQGWGVPLNVTPGITSCMRYAELIHKFYIYYLVHETLENIASAPYTWRRLTDQFFWLSVGLAFLISFLMVKPILKQLANNGFHRLLCLGRSPTKKNYHLLELHELQDEKVALKRYVTTQKSKVEKSKWFTHILTGGLFIYCLSALFSTRWSDSALGVLPMLVTLVLNTLFSSGVEKYETIKITRQLQAVEKTIKETFSSVVNLCSIAQQSNCLTIVVAEDSKELPVSYIASIIKAVLNRYSVYLRAYDDTSLAIASEAKIPTEAKAFFEELLKNSSIFYGLKNQLNNLKKRILQVNPDFYFDPIFSLRENEFKFVISGDFALSPQDQSSLSLIPGITIRSHDIVLQRLEPLDEKKEIATLYNVFKKFDRNDHYTAPLPSAGTTTTARGRVNADPQPRTTESVPRVIADAVDIDWGHGLRFPQNQQIKSIKNAHNRFVLWDLPVTQFNGDAKAYTAFHDHSTQMARRKRNAQGIKHGAYVGEDFHNRNRQEVFPARIKVLGNRFGIFGVLLSIRTAANGGILYQTCAYARVH